MLIGSRDGLRRKARIRLLGLANGGPHSAAGQYVISYNPNYHLSDGGYDGGMLATTSDPAQATEFSVVEAYALIQSGPLCQCHHLRPDGRPNRPLTAFNVELSTTDERTAMDTILERFDELRGDLNEAIEASKPPDPVPPTDQKYPYPRYDPTPDERVAVARCIFGGAPDDVAYIDRGAAASSPVSQNYHEIWFTSSNGTQYTAGAEALADNYYIGIREMSSPPLEMLEGQKNA